MEREQALAFVAIHSQNVVYWRYTKGEGWSQTGLSPERLEAFSDADLAEWIEQRERFRDEHRALLREMHPGVFDQVEKPLLGLCASCWVPLERKDRVYATWSEAAQTWMTYCERHRPEGNCICWRGAEDE